VCISIQLLNQVTDFYANWHEYYATGGRRNTILSDFIGQ